MRRWGVNFGSVTYLIALLIVTHEEGQGGYLSSPPLRICTPSLPHALTSNPTVNKMKSYMTERLPWK